jgi:hypothetical protein
MPALKTIGLHLSYLALEGAYIPREYYVFHDRQLVYMPIFKVASTSIKTALLRPYEQHGEYPQYMTVHKEGTLGHHFLFGRSRRRYFKFAFVRNPFDRLVSCYVDRVRRPIYQPVGRCYFASDYNHVLIKSLFGRAFDPSMTFENFVRLVAKIPDYLSDGHFKSQYAWLHRFGTLIPEYVGRVESIGDDWRPLAERFSLPSLTRLNASTRDGFVSYYSSSAIVDAVAERYERDIVTFGYEDEYWKLRRECRTRTHRISACEVG